MPRLLSLSLLVVLVAAPAVRAGGERRLLYVVAPGIRNYLEFGGAGVLVFDIDKDYAFVRRIETPASRVEKPENVKGVCASAATSKLYFTTLTRLYCLDLATDKTLWEKALPGGCDRLAITPDGKTLYVPTLEKEYWNVVDANSGQVLRRIDTKKAAHNTICSLDGAEAYLADRHSPDLTVVDTKTGKVRLVGPFTDAIRPFTVNGKRSRCYVCVDDLLGYEVGDLKTGKKLLRVEVKGFDKGKPKRHGCPSHGVGLTPDEKEVWVCDAVNRHLHVFDNTTDPPKQVAGIKLREEPGWVTFRLDGKHAWPSTGEVIDVATKKVLLALKDEKDREVHTEKVVEVHFKDGKVVRAGDQFGLGRNTD